MAAVLDLLLDYLLRVDWRCLRAREYGLMLSSLAVDRQSARFLTDALEHARCVWSKQRGYQLYITSERSSLIERLSLPSCQGRQLTLAGMHEASKRIGEAFAEASKYILQFSRVPRLPLRCLRGDYQAVVNWVTAWAAVERATQDGSSEFLVQFMKKEFGRASGVLQAKAFRDGPPQIHEDPNLDASELSLAWACSVYTGARHEEIATGARTSEGSARSPRS